MSKIIPVILSGGFGTRLRPLSRRPNPKQFSNITVSTSLHQQTALRLQKSRRVDFVTSMTLTNNDFCFIIVDHHPWGWYKTLVFFDCLQAQKIYLKEGAALSLQNHHHRSKHWVIVEGIAQVIAEDNVTLVKEGQSVYIPLGVKHRLQKPNKVDVVLAEVQTAVCSEDDNIIRYHDIYQRQTPT